MPRSTRNKIRWQAKQAIEAVNRAIGHMNDIDDFAEERSDYINKQISNVVFSLELCQQVLIKFRGGL